jgi:hypothetical protein
MQGMFWVRDAIPSGPEHADPGGDCATKDRAADQMTDSWDGSAVTCRDVNLGAGPGGWLCQDSSLCAVPRTGSREPHAPSETDEF